MNSFRNHSRHVTIGHLLLDMGLITREQLIRAMETKLRSTPGQLIGEVLIAQGALTRSQLERALSQQKLSRPPIEEFHRMSRELLAQASDGAETLNRRLDDLAVRMGRVMANSSRFATRRNTQ